MLDPHIGDRWALLAFTSGASLAQLFLVYASPRLGYDISLAFLFAAVVILPAPSVVLVSVLMFLPIWRQAKFPWYMPVFNMANYAVPALITKLIVPDVDEIMGLAGGLRLGAATVLFTLINHAALAGVVKLARGETIRQSRLFTFTHLSLDTLVLCSGAAIAMVWHQNPISSLFAMLPLILIARALQIPKLEQESWTDPKTGLYNARFFGERGAEVVRRGRGLTALAMIDLDYLREVNNAHGHLAGDAVVTAIAKVIGASARATDMPARFGGEEFALLMPATPLDAAIGVAERVRIAVEETGVATEGVVIHATVSIGVASGPGTLEELIRRADKALYAAKAAGRNRVMVADEPTEDDSDDRRTVPVSTRSPVM
ncbi:MAG TPA: GGDEF domain-containing protein [Miltoncostaeales bacterium]|nr:GGDEF domain-containing protein [Miltoncostaeales bacterium]